MISNKLIGFIGILLGSIVFGQLNQDARMLGLNGSYTTIARGYQCIGVNPANLAAYNYRSVNLLNLNIGLSNNAFSLTNYNAINGANLEDTLSFKSFKVVLDVSDSEIVLNRRYGTFKYKLSPPFPV